VLNDVATSIVPDIAGHPGRTNCKGASHPGAGPGPARAWAINRRRCLRAWLFLGGGDLRLRLDGAWSDSATTTLKLSQERGEVFRLRDKLSWRARFHDHF
jgi:hypothetical protein